MARPLSIDLRQRIVAAVHAGETRLAAARRFGVCSKTVANYLKLEAAGSLAPRNPAPQPLRKFTPDAVEAMKNGLKEKNDPTLEQLQRRLKAEFDIHVTLPAIWIRLTAEKLTWKKNKPCRRTGTPGCAAGPGGLA